jgi:hypothetical protein
MADSSFDRIKVALDSITMIDKLIEDANLPSGTLDPPNINEIIENNRKHLLNEKNKGGFNETQVELINTKVSEAATFIENNPNNGGGGGVSPYVAFFQDCKLGFEFGVNFSPEYPNLKIGDTYGLQVTGYRGCGQVISTPKKTPPIYTSPSIVTYFDFCQQCIDKF